MALRITAFLLILISLNIYVCYQYENVLVLLKIAHSVSFFRLIYFLIVTVFLGSIFYQSAMLEKFASKNCGLPLLDALFLSKTSTWLMTVYLGMFVYGAVIFAAFDAAFLLGSFFPRDWNVFVFINRLYRGGLSVFIMSLLITFYGMWNAGQTPVREYRVVIDKRSNISELRLAMISDVHLGTAVNEKGLASLVRKVNELSPDIVCVIGDLFDHSTTEALKEAAAASLSQLRPALGSYYVFGNHEHYLGDAFAETSILRGTLTFLNDDRILVEDAFYLIGRDDATNKRRSSIETLTSGLDKAKPIILLDHQPHEIKANIDAGVDLQLSGHTHCGQLFPFGLLVKAFNGLFYGHYEIGSAYQAIVSSGAGVWRYPIRVGSSSEIVSVKICFKAPESE